MKYGQKVFSDVANGDNSLQNQLDSIKQQLDQFNIQIESIPNSTLRSSGNWNMKGPAIPFETIYAAKWNDEFQNVINNCNPDGVGGSSEDVSNMQATLNPFPGSSPYLSNSLRQELEELRYQLNVIIGKSYWYELPSKSIEDLQVEIVDNTVDGANLHDHTGIGIDGGGALIGTDAYEDGSITKEKLAFNITGSVVNSVYIQDSSKFNVSGTNIIPLDDTIPQKTEGLQYMHYAYTPKKINNKLMISFVCGGMSTWGGNGDLIIAIFFNSDDNASASSASFMPPWESHTEEFSIRHEHTITSLDVLNIYIRLGTNVEVPTANPFIINNNFNGTQSSSMKIEEVEIDE